MAATLPRPNGARSGISTPPSGISAMKKASLIARPSTPSRMSSMGQTGVLSTSKSLQKSVSISSFPQPPRGLRTSLSPPSSLGANRRLSALAKGTTSPTAPPQQQRSSARKSNVSVSSFKKMEESGLLSVLPSPPPSRSGSAEGTYGSPTTFESISEGAHVIRGGGGGGDSPRKESKGNVIVSVRCRPDPNGDNGECPFVVDGRNSRVVYRNDGGDYIYDNVFAPDDDNSRVYDACAKRLVRRVMEGYHGTVFAYGMTGTGKTFSMQGTTSSPGVIPLAINDIFSYIRETPHREFLLRVSYLEIYNEKIHDLLSTPPSTKNGVPEQPQEEIKLREDAKRGVYATPLKEEIVQSPTQLLRVIARGDMARRVAGTQFNARSSRSHAVVQVVVESRERQPGGNPMGTHKGMGGVRVSTLSLIDLAGSERAAESKERRQEGSHINRSLLTLGTVIARLSETKGKDGKDKDGSHLPYRDSKLTRLLQPALSGNSLVSILCTISAANGGPGGSSLNETLNTLKFAARARNNIISHAKKAEDGHPMGLDHNSKVLLERYRAEIDNLKAQLELAGKQKDEQADREREEKERERHEEQMLEMQLARTALKERIEHLGRLILCSKSSGVNSQRNSSQLIHPGHLSSTLSSRSSMNFSHVARTSYTPSTAGSPLLPGSQHLSINSDSSFAPPPEFSNTDEDSTGGEYNDGMASLSIQVRALQADVADKNRYIATLEKRLLQARRSSQSRTSLGFTPHGQALLNDSGLIEEASLGNLLKDKDSEIADLRARLDDKERMVAALRSATRNRDIAESSGGSRNSVCSACGGVGTTGSRVNSYIAPLPTNADLHLGLSRIRTKSLDDVLSIKSRNSTRVSSVSTNTSMNASPVITTTPLPFPPSTKTSNPKLKPFILPWKLATTGDTAPITAPDVETESVADGDEDDGEAVIAGGLGIAGGDVDVHVARLSMGSRLERHDSNGSIRKREGFLSGFRNGGDGGIGLPPQIGVEELGLGEIVEVR